MPKENIQTMQEFANHIHEFNRKDYYVLMGSGGMPGVGKSTFMVQLQQAYSRRGKLKWDFGRLTWERKELREWIDGKTDSKPHPSTGLRPGQVPEYSAILPDELWHMFYKRKWHDSEQQDTIATFNMCRDRHLFVGGNVPFFFQLDKDFTSLFNFYVYIPYRGTAWVFVPEENPFSDDPWNQKENKKLFRRHRSPANCPNYLCTIRFGDWEPKDKKKYLAIRNKKRVTAIEEKTKKVPVRAAKRAIAMAKLMRYAIQEHGLSQLQLSKIMGVERPTIPAWLTHADKHYLDVKI